MKTKDFLKAGFVEDNTDPMFRYEKSLIPDDVIEDNELEEDEVPKLLFGDTGINSGFCIYTGKHFVWFNAESPQDAVEFANRITSFEPI